jgi:hypothetical protein
MAEKNAAKEFVDELERNDKLQAKIKLGLESLVKIAADFDVTEEELTAELQKRWSSQIIPGVLYSEPPGF